jgi:hypothetical protein
MILQLKEILSDPDNKAAIRWLPHGKSFLVLDRKKFVQMVLPKYLGKATKYTSFTRKLTRWNFWRMPSGPDEGAWLNEVRFRNGGGCGRHQICLVSNQCSIYRAFSGTVMVSSFGE